MQKRDEIKEEDKWNLKAVYENSDAIDKDYQYVIKEMDKLDQFKGHLLDDPNKLYQTLKTNDEVMQVLERLYVYAKENYDVDTTNSESMNLKGKIENLLQKVNEKTAYFNSELLEQDFHIVEKFERELPELKHYHRILENVFRLKKHNLSEAEEKIIAKLSKTLNGGNEAAFSLRNSDLKFGQFIDQFGETQELTHANYSNYIKSQDREVRKNVFEIMHQTYHNFRNTFATMYQTEVEASVRLAEIYRYKDAREKALYPKEIDSKIYDQLIDGINQNIDVVHDYFKLKKEILKLDEFHTYDIYTELVKEVDKKYTFEEAKELVINALSVLGKDYVDILNQAFNDGWIDKYPNTSKRTGAYSFGSYDTFPYVLLNFDGSYHSVSTLAHELGHSIHSYLSRKNNSFTYHDYKIFVAEVASTTNEILFNDYMLKHSKDKNEKLMILNQQMELFKSTIFRQTMFAEFELKTHQEVEKGNTLTADLLENMYLELVKKYHGSDVVIDDLIKTEWERIPHFYMNFYVYQYATGLSAASKIASNILNHEECAVENYLKFLSLGNSMPPVEELKVAGVDISNKETITDALNLFKANIEEFKKLYQERE